MHATTHNYNYCRHRTYQQIESSDPYTSLYRYFEELVVRQKPSHPFSKVPFFLNTSKHNTRTTHTQATGHTSDRHRMLGRETYALGRDLGSQGRTLNAVPVRLEVLVVVGMVL
jgi:hypothetical protein